MRNSLLVPDKYNGDLLDENGKNGLSYTVQMDYLTLNLKGTPFADSSGDIEYIPADYGTKVYEDRGEIVYKGVTVGTLMFNPRSSIIDSELCQFKLENALFYLLDSSTLHELIKAVLTRLGLKYVGVNRLDVALDFDGNAHQIQDVIKAMSVGELRVSGRPKDVKLFSQTKAGVMTFQGVQIGSRTTSRFLRIYNKTLEQQKTPKTYIADRWKKAGLNGEVWRYEYQLNNRYLRNIKDLTLEKLCNIDYLYNLLVDAQNAHFELKHNTGKTEVNKERTFNFLDFSYIRQKLHLLAVAVEKIRRNICESLIGQKRLVKGLLRSYFSTNQNPNYLKPVRETLYDYGLVPWFEDKIGDYLKEFKKKQILKTYNEQLFNKHLAL